MDTNTIFEIIESALANSGLKVMDGDHSCVIVRDAKTDTDYQISVKEIAS